MMPLDLDAIRREFPILHTEVEGYRLVYLDSAATSQKPRAVLEAMTSFYERDNGGVHRGMHALAQRSTEAYEQARRVVQRFLKAPHAENIVFTKSCTEAINLVARSWGGTHLKKGDAIVLTLLEHHANVVPWQQLKEEKQIEIRWIDITDDGNLRMDQLDAALADGKVKLITVTAQSNMLGVRPPIQEIVKKGHTAGAVVLVDAAQAAPHMPLDVQELDCDFLAFSGHKVYGPTGIGVLCAKREHLLTMPPLLGGGGMIREVTQDSFTPADPPARFEGGTPPVAEAVGLAAAIEWLTRFEWNAIAAHEEELIARAIKQLKTIEGLRLLGPADAAHPACRQAGAHGCISFTVKDIHPHDLTELLGNQGICLRAGHHCTQPLHRRLGIIASTRLSVGIYSTREEIERVPKAIAEARALLLD